MLRLLYCFCSSLQLWLLFYLLPRRSSSTKSGLLVWLLVFLLQSGTNDFTSHKTQKVTVYIWSWLSFYEDVLFISLFIAFCTASCICFLWCCVAASALQRAPLLYFRFHSGQVKSSSFPVHLCPSRTLTLRSPWNLISSEKGLAFKNWINNFSVKIPKIHSNTSLKVHSLQPWGRNRWRWIA